MTTRWMRTGFGALATVALVSSGCSEMGANTAKPTDLASPGQSNAPATASPSPRPPAVKLPSLADRAHPSGDKGAIVGWVAYQGTPPKPKPINFGAEKVCADLNKNASPLYETLVINSNSTVKGT